MTTAIWTPMTSTPERSDEASPRLLSLLHELALAGEGTVLGLVPAARARLRRVSRPSAQFEQRFHTAYQEQFPALIRFAASRVGDRHRAEDVVQRAYETVWRSQCARPRTIDNLAAYLVTAVANETHRELREVIPARHRIEHDEEVPGRDPTRLTAEAITLRDLLPRLPRREHQAVVLRFQWQLTVAETARTMGVSEGAVKRYAADGVARLRDRLGPTRIGA